MRTLGNDKNYDMKLLIVPEYQKSWFVKNSRILKKEVKNSELICFDMLLDNIFGINNRFIKWKHTNNGIIDDIVENYILHDDKTQFIIDLLICLLEDCKELEYYEIANNINLIILKSNEQIAYYDEQTK
jgi:hypothetical protein